jgi:hypothetical protein
LESKVRALLTTAGFIGCHLKERLLHDGPEVCVLANFATGHRLNLLPLGDELEVVEGDLQSYERVPQRPQGCEYADPEGEGHDRARSTTARGVATSSMPDHPSKGWADTATGNARARARSCWTTPDWEAHCQGSDAWRKLARGSRPRSFGGPPRPLDLVADGVVERYAWPEQATPGTKLG